MKSTGKFLSVEANFVQYIEPPECRANVAGFGEAGLYSRRTLLPYGVPIPAPTDATNPCRSRCRLDVT